MRGQGFTRQQTGFFSARRECLACGGAGEVPRVRCRELRRAPAWSSGEQDYTVRVPPGSVGGQHAAGGGRGLARPARRARPATCFVNVRVRPHPFYREEGGLLVCELPVSPTEAALGAEVEVPLLDAAVRMKVPAGTQSGARVPPARQGAARAPAGAARGRPRAGDGRDARSVSATEARALLSRLEASAAAEAPVPRRQAFRRLADAAERRREAARRASATDERRKRTDDGPSRAPPPRLRGCTCCCSLVTLLTTTATGALFVHPELAVAAVRTGCRYSLPAAGHPGLPRVRPLLRRPAPRRAGVAALLHPAAAAGSACSAPWGR